MQMQPATAVTTNPDASPRGTGTVFVVLVLVALFVLAMGGAGAGADPQQPAIVGNATVEPGQTLWDVAVAHAPDGSDPRAYLRKIRDLNEIDAGSIPPWTVVLLPAP